MKATRTTIPSLASGLAEFKNDSGTLRGIKNPVLAEFLAKDTTSQLNEEEKDRLRIDAREAGIQYLIVSYDTPIAWVTKTGWTYKVRQKFSQTTSKHVGLLYMLPEGFNQSHIVRH